jgi:hypothetical protein
MSRDGFATGDVDTGLLADPKIVNLARRLRDPVTTGAYIALYVAVVLESWASGQRMTLDDAAPAWWLEPIDDARDHLQAVGLLDAEARIPEHAWAGWFGPAERRRQAGRDRWHRWNDRQRAQADSKPLANGVPTPTVPTVPTVPTDRPTDSVVEDPRKKAGDDFGEEWQAFLDEWFRRFRLPPSGGQDEYRTQRSLLWEVVRAYPNKAAQWLNEAPVGLDSFHAVDHVRKAWRREQSAAAA